MLWTHLTPGPNLGQVLAAQAQPISLLILLPGLGMTLVGLAFMAYAWVKRLGFRYLLFGAAAWAVAVALKLAWAVTENAGIYDALKGTLGETAGSWIFYVYVGLLTGIFEVALLWVFLSRTRFGRMPWPQALSFAIGFGSIEALLVGLSSLLPAASALLTPSALAPSTLVQLARAANPLFGLAPIVERAATTFLHVFACLLIFYAINAGQKRWVWIAILYKTANDSVAAFAQFWGVDTLTHLWTIEAVIILFGLMGVWGVRWLANGYVQESRRKQAFSAAPS